MGVAWRAGSWLAADVGKGMLYSVNKPKCRPRRALVQVVGKRLINIPADRLARDNRFGFHDLLRDSADLRTRSRRLSK